MLMFKHRKRKISEKEGTKPRRILILVKVKAFKPYDKSCRIKHTCRGGGKKCHFLNKALLPQSAHLEMFELKWLRVYFLFHSIV